MAKGIIYVCSTVVDGLVKIGKTGSENFEQRMSNLENNGYRNVTGIKRRFAIEVENYDDIEILLDDIFSKSRVGGTELFSVDISKVIQLLSSFKGRQVYPIDEKPSEVFKEATDAAQSNSLLPDGTYTYNNKSKTDGKSYQGTLACSHGLLVLKKGSTLAPLTSRGTNAWISTRKSFGEGATILKEDLNCSSVSIASNYVCGHESNGWSAWKDKNGNLIDTYRQKAKKEES